MLSELEVGSSANVLKERQVLRLGSASSWPDPASLAAECLSAAEAASEEVLKCIYPTLDSEEERTDVIDHLRRLIKTHVNCDIFPYGSGPLKTYLPDGDIDLTVLRDPSAGESLADDVLAVLRGEEQNENSEYKISNIQFIGAEVKIVKCIVQNTVVDISFNQLGGLSTVCFLEQVDRLVGRDHLFKRSIILIKTWGLYENHILGAAHGLLSTYALEILILYIFQLFHSTISGPLMALYTFLDHYSRFDWDNCCISLMGPVCISSLPNIEVKMPDGGLNDLLLDEELLEDCVDMFAVPLKALEANERPFQPKNLNIIDPLKKNNNLGRSVNRGNYFRIRTAFKHGARTLGHVLSLPSDQVADGIDNFFTNCLSRHRKPSRREVEHLDVEVVDEACSIASSSSEELSSSMYDMLLESSSSDVDNNSVGADAIPSTEDELDRCLAEEVSSSKASESCCAADRVIASRSASTSDRHKVETNNSILRTGARASYHLSHRKVGASRGGDVKSPSKIESRRPKISDKESGLNSWLEDAEKHAEISDSHLKSVFESTRADSSTPKATELSGVGVESEAVDCLADLTGDYDSQLRGFLHGQLTIGVSSFTPTLSNPPPSTSGIRGVPIQHSVPPPQSHRFQVNPPAFSTGQAMYSVLLPASGFYTEGRNSRGTGTYIPSVATDYYRSPPARGRGRGRFQAPVNRNHLHRHPHSSATHPAANRTNSAGQGSHGQWRSHARRPSPVSAGDGDQSSTIQNSSGRIEFGTVGNLAEEVISASNRGRSSSALGPSRNPRFHRNEQ